MVTPKLRALLLTLLLTLPLDQATKFWVDVTLPLEARVPLVAGLIEITHVRNPGAVFGLLNGMPVEWLRWVFGVVTLFAVGVVLSFFRRLAPGDRRNAVALGLVLGGALGNFADRAMRGEVIDFLHVRLWGGYVWPDFNFADVAIVLGVGALILDMLVAEAESRAA